jgi:hypothetical protein
LATSRMVVGMVFLNAWDILPRHVIIFLNV